MIGLIQLYIRQCELFFVFRDSDFQVCLSCLFTRCPVGLGQGSFFALECLLFQYVVHVSLDSTTYSHSPTHFLLPDLAKIGRGVDHIRLDLQKDSIERRFIEVSDHVAKEVGTLLTTSCSFHFISFHL